MEWLDICPAICRLNPWKSEVEITISQKSVASERIVKEGRKHLNERRQEWLLLEEVQAEDSMSGSEGAQAGVVPRYRNYRRLHLLGTRASYLDRY